MKRNSFQPRLTMLCALIFFVVSQQEAFAQTLTKEKIQAALDEAYEKFKNLKEGKKCRLH